VKRADEHPDEYRRFCLCGYRIRSRLGGAAGKGLVGGLVFPDSNGPLSAQQVEERIHTVSNGASTAETLVSQIYRDSVGRMRIEWLIRGSGGSFGIVYLLDPGASSVFVLLVDQKLAYRMTVPRSNSRKASSWISGRVGEPCRPGNDIRRRNRLSRVSLRALRWKVPG
jgi:hypothetical protein